MIIMINSTDDGVTVKDLLRRLRMSSSQIKHIKFLPDGLTVNGERVTVRRVLRAGDILHVRDGDSRADVNPYIVPSPLDVRIVYEDDDIAVADKPPDMPTHPSRGHAADTLANALANRYSGEPYVFRPISRLDRDTSGLVLTARSRLAASIMSARMARGEVHKMYVAVLEGVPREKSGVVRGYILRCTDSIITRRFVSEDAYAGEGEECATGYAVIAEAGGRCAVAVRPYTGRTHQIRATFAAMGCPLAGDELYGGSRGLIGRQALHACSLRFEAPCGDRLALYSAPPTDIRSLIAALFGEAAERDIVNMIEEGTLPCL